MLNSGYRKDDKYYPQVLLEECKYVINQKKKSIKEIFTDDVEIFSDDSDKENSDKENPAEENQIDHLLRKYNFPPEIIRNFLILELKI